MTALPFRSKTDLVTEFLREELKAGRPAAGERLVVARVAEALGVSKIPVREAVTRLVGEGLLVVRPNVGPVVPSFTSHEVEETALMRVALEGLALDTASGRHTEDSLAQLAELLERMDSPDADFPALNVQFHLAVLAPSPYEELLRVVSSLLERTQRYATVHAVPGYRQAAHEEHVEMRDLLAAGDYEQLKALNERHIVEAAQRLVRAMTSSDDVG